jgi:(2R)-ethylmalonyl-CoA mutase
LGYMKERLVASLTSRMRQIEAGERSVVGVNTYTESEPSPLVEGMGQGFASVERIERATEAEQIDRLEAWRKDRDQSSARRCIDAVRSAAETGENLVPVSIEAARAGVTTGEWADALRGVFGEYRPPTGVGGTAATAGEQDSLADARRRVEEAARRRKVPRLRMLVGKPGLDGHSNAAEQVAVRARDAGFEVIYQGLRLTPSEIARAAADEDVHVIGLSIMSGAHMLLVPDVLERLRDEGIDPERVPVVVGGVISNDEAKELMSLGVARVYTPHDHDLTRMVSEMADLIR